MDILPILNAEGQRIYRFGGEQAFKVRQVGDYMVSLEWYGPTTRTIDACVAVWSARGGLDAGAWVISRNRIADYTDEHNRPTNYAFAEAKKALVVMGRSPLWLEVRRLVGVLMDQVDDLVLMPVAPVAVKRALAGEAIWEVTQKDKQTGKVITEAAV